MGVLPKIFAGSWGLRQISSESEAHCYVSADVSIIKLIPQHLWLYSFNLKIYSVMSDALRPHGL